MKKLLATLSAVALAGVSALALAQPAPPADAVVGVSYNTNKIGEKTFDIHGGHVNYFDAGSFKPIDWSLNFDNVRKGWTLTTHNFHPFIPEFADGVASFRDVWKGKDRTITFRAVSSHVAGQITRNLDDPVFQGVAGNDPENFAVVYPDAFGLGKDLSYYLSRHKLHKVASVENPNLALAPVVFEWELGLPVGEKLFDKPVERKAKPTRERNPETKFMATSDLVIGASDDVGEDQLSFIGGFSAWDSEGKSHPVTVEFFRSGGKLILRKTLPLSSLQAATGTLYTDAATDYFAGAGDGDVRAVQDADWATTRGDTTGASNVDTTSPSLTLVDVGATYDIYRAFLPVDTSAISDSATITAAVLNLYGTEKGNADNDGQDYIVVVEGTQASTSALENEDIDNVGSTAWSDTIDLGSFSTTGYNSLTLNATGLAAVSKTGFTKLAIREGHDMENAPTAGQNYTRHATSEASGTSTDPKLTVTTEAAGGGAVFFFMSKAVDLLAPFAFAND